ncbi:MAG: hypothetical protein DHS20C11_26540 [Lysobacteraceae bacterium]|nr:MAG: hypothetical protein DHS20C11_26540 [Xanthomonadaceae bacterium]
MTARSEQASAQWWQHPDRQRLLQTENRLIAEVLAGVFGYHGLWVSPDQPMADAKTGPYHWVSLTRHANACRGAVRTDIGDWPWQSGAFAVVVLQHVIDCVEDPSAIFDQVERVLSPDGVLLLTAFNPLSVLGLQTKWSARGGDINVGAIDRATVMRNMQERSMQCMLWRACHFGPFERPLKRRFANRLLGGSYLAVIRKHRGATIKKLRPRSVVSTAQASGVSAKVACRARHAALVVRGLM